MMKMERIRFFTFGCKTNQYDTQVFRHLFSKVGYIISDDASQYDIAVVNTCCVTKKAEKEAKRLIRKLISLGKRVWLTGCLVERKQSLDFQGIYILPRQLLYERAISMGIRKISSFHNHTRAFVKIVDGCENFCSYCIVPFVRGRIKSRGVSDILDEIKQLAMNSHKEIVLTGIDTGAFGKDTGQSIIDIIKGIEEIDAVARFRLSSIEVFYIDDNLCHALASSRKFCPSFHIPLQSGSDRILGLMKRPYLFSQYKKRIEMISSFFNYVTFTTDIMVGFPGETEKDFEMTVEAVKECKFLKVHLFPFSLHPETTAASLPGKISPQVKKKRLEKLFQITQEVARKVKEEFIGKRCRVLVEERINNFWSGYSEHYIPVLINSPDNIANKIVEVEPQCLKEIEGNVYLFASTILP